MDTLHNRPAAQLCCVLCSVLYWHSLSVKETTVKNKKKSAHMQTSNITHIKIKFDLITFKGFMCAVRGVARNRNQKIMKTILRVRKREEVNSYNSDALKCLMKFNIILNRCIVKRSIISLHVYINLPHNDNNRHTRMF